ncbi:MAG: histidine triad nucleotide-binding protein [bacterium]|nr:histidine triad nucleotide-binding protein [bacterium]
MSKFYEDERVCIFCKIIKGEIPAQKVYEDTAVMAFKDIQPKAPVHLLIIPKKHIPTLLDLTENETEIAGKLILVANKLAKENNIAESGYRVVFNCNRDAGQAVFHIHLHLLGGRQLNWPPG